LVVGACACWAVDNSVTANLAELAPAHITFAKGVVAGSVNLAIGLVAGVPSGWPVLGALVVGAIGYGASITLWVSGARDLGAARGQLGFAGAPFVGAIVSWTVLGEAVAWRQVVALTVAAVGVALVLRSDTARAPPCGDVHDHEQCTAGRERPPSRPRAPDRVRGRHRHEHVHVPEVHHTHVPDLHHRHRHQ
jgi:drug/metabolite transporter (DMT)-like permease